METAKLNRTLLSAERLHEVLHYNPATGLFTWRYSTIGHRTWDTVGRVNRHGYWEVSIGDRRHRLHRLAFLYMTGRWPKADIDHINLDKTDNRWRNLREATRTQNFGNMRRRCNNTSGGKGVCWHKGAGKWQVRVGPNHYVGLFATFEEANAAYSSAAKEYFGEFARLA